MKLTLSSFVMVAMAFVLMATTAVAAPIPDLFNTGVDNSGVTTLIPTNDIHYTLISAPIVTPAVSSAANAGWLPNTPPTSQWIGPSPTPNLSAPGGLYIYELVFDLTGLDETTAQISGDWASDNSSLVRLNGGPGIAHTNSPAPFKQLDPFSFNTGFLPGLNSLTFEVTNFSGPSGLLVTDIRGDALPIPEPATCMLMVIGCSSVVCSRRRRR